MKAFTKKKSRVAIGIAAVIAVTLQFSVFAGVSMFGESTAFAEGQGSLTAEAAGAKQTEAAIAEAAGTYADGEILVAFKSKVDSEEAEEISEDLGAEEVTEIKDGTLAVTAVVELPKDQTVAEAVAEYDAESEIAYAQPNYKYTISEKMADDSLKALQNASNEAVSTVTAFDYSNLWHFDKINVTDAWDLLKDLQNTEVKVAVLDTGLNTDHEDLQANINKNLCGEVVDGQVLQGSVDDDNGHGTHVTGIIGATANNSKGGAGVASGREDDITEVFTVDVFEGAGAAAYTDDIITGINYAVNKGAKVINMSLGYLSDGSYDPEDLILKKVVDEATGAGTAVICAAGNESDSTHKNYPSDFESCVSVISTTSTDTRSGFSNYGADKDISAPGSYIYSTYKNSYGYMSGTSMASPVVAAVAAMIYSVNPNFTVSEVKEILYSTAKDIYAAGKDADSGYGRVDAEAAVSEAIDRTAVSGRASLKATSKSYNRIKLTWPKLAGAKGYQVYKYSPSSGNYKKIKDVDYSVLAYTDTLSTAGNYHQYKMRAKKVANGKTVYNNYTFSAKAKTSFARPARLITKNLNNKIRLRWSKVSGASGYEVYRATKKSGTYKRCKRIAGTSSVKYTNKVKQGKRYYYKVRAYKNINGKRTYGSFSYVRSGKAY